MAYPKCKECGLKFKDQSFLDRHIEKEHKDYGATKQKGWCTPHGFIDFSEKVTYEHACKVAKNINEKYA